MSKNMSSLMWFFAMCFLIGTAVMGWMNLQSQRRVELAAQQRVEFELERLGTETKLYATLSELRWVESQAFQRWMERHNAIDLVDRICWEE